MKKLVAILLSVMMLLALVAACTSAEESQAPPPAGDNGNQTSETAPTPAPAPTTPDEPPTEISIWFNGGNADNDDTIVVEAVNARLQELGLNITIRPVWTGGWGMGDPAQIALNTADASIDIFWTGSWGLNYFNNAQIGNFVRLDDPNNNLLERYGRDVMAEVDELLWNAFTTEGPSGRGLYGVPGPKDSAAWFKLEVNNDRLVELGFDFDEIFSITESNHEIIFDPIFEEIMQAAKDLYGDGFFPLNLEAGNFLNNFSCTDGDLTGINAFHFPFDPNNPAQPVRPEVTLQVENELYLRVLERTRDFWNLGFIDPRLAIGEDAGIDRGEILRAGEFIFSTGQYAYGHTATVQSERGLDIRFVPLSRVPIVSTMSAAGSGFAISVYSRNQEAAMQFINAWYTDNTLTVLLSEGVEGVHWNPDENGLIVLDTDARDSIPYQTWRFGMGNVFMLTPRNTDGAEYIEGFRAYNELGVGTAFLGFVFDSEPVAIQAAAMRNVVDEFRTPLTVGGMDLETAVPAYIAALRAAGADDVLAELNRQLDEFFAGR
ncbi:MAG: ABC transporter substrate-binding protein [Oscillospiraceae bacterium]|nr:ABC transporter substrate-binding protein [Oscillospiraceae bacterium]MCL2279407.1 ABC transporter substrate-binding protein [Oscillospiraceae bacterium]